MVLHNNEMIAFLTSVTYKSRINKITFPSSLFSEVVAAGALAWKVKVSCDGRLSLLEKPPLILDETPIDAGDFAFIVAASKAAVDTGEAAKMLDEAAADA